MPIAQLLADAGTAIENARAFIGRFKSEHIQGLYDLADQASEVASSSGASSPEAVVVDIVHAALDELQSLAQAAFERTTPPPADASDAQPPDSDSPVATGP